MQKVVNYINNNQMNKKQISKISRINVDVVINISVNKKYQYVNMYQL